MRKVITINLNNNAYQIDEEGYDSLRAYLDTAERNLAGNPDRAEIMIDLEAAIGDKCRACLGVHKSVVSVADMQRILTEMGPVEGSASSTQAPGSSSDAGAAAERRLYRMPDGAMWAGVCNGLAAYFGFDVVWVRVAFILLTLFTSGVWLLIYVAMIFIVPRAETAEQVAAARGQPFNAQELIDRLKKKPEEFRSRHARMSHPGFGWSRESGVPTPGAAARVTGGVFLPILTSLSALWFAAMLLAVYFAWSAYEPGGIAGWGLGWSPGGDPDWQWGRDWGWPLPRWVAIVAILAVYALLAMPIGAGRRASLYYANGGRLHGWADAWSGLLWLALVAVMIWIAWYFTPGLQQMLRGMIAGPSVFV